MLIGLQYLRYHVLHFIAGPYNELLKSHDKLSRADLLKWDSVSKLYGMWLTIWDLTVLSATRRKWTHPAV